MKKLWLKFLDLMHIIDTAWRKLFLWLAGFRNIQELFIRSKGLKYTTFYSMKSDKILHRQVFLTTNSSDNTSEQTGS